MSEPDDFERSATQRAVNGAGHAARSAELSVDRAVRLMRLVLYGVAALVVVSAGLVYVTQQLGRDVDGVDQDTRALQQQVTDLEEFAESLVEPTPEQEAQNAAITTAVRQVPEIRAILCEEFPSAAAAADVTCP